MFLCALLLAATMRAADLAAVKAEPDLNKRAEMAMSNAEQATAKAADAFSKGNPDAARGALAEVQASAELACNALEETRGAPRNNKYYKRVELSMRSLLRRLEDLSREASIDDRDSVEKVQKRVQDLHDQILLDIMSKRK